MNDDKAKTCKHSTGKIGQIAVYVRPTCPNMHIIRGVITASRGQCRRCRFYKKQEGMA